MALFRLQTLFLVVQGVNFYASAFEGNNSQPLGKSFHSIHRTFGGLILALPEKDMPLSRHPSSSCLGSHTMDLLLRGPTVWDPFHLD